MDFFGLGKVDFYFGFIAVINTNFLRYIKYGGLAIVVADFNSETAEVSNFAGGIRMFRFRLNQIFLAVLLCLLPLKAFPQNNRIAVPAIQCAPGVKCGPLASLEKARKDLNLLPYLQHKNGRRIQPREYRRLADADYYLPVSAKPNKAQTLLSLRSARAVQSTRAVSATKSVATASPAKSAEVTLSPAVIDQIKKAVADAVQPIVTENNN